MPDTAPVNSAARSPRDLKLVFSTQILPCPGVNFLRFPDTDTDHGICSATAQMDFLRSRLQTGIGAMTCEEANIQATRAAFKKAPR